MSWRNAVNPGSMTREEQLQWFLELEQKGKGATVVGLREIHGIGVACDEEQSVTPEMIETIERVLPTIRFSSHQSEIVRTAGALERVAIRIGHKIGKRELMRSLYSDPGKWIVHGPNR